MTSAVMIKVNHYARRSRNLAAARSRLALASGTCLESPTNFLVINTQHDDTEETLTRLRAVLMLDEDETASASSTTSSQGSNDGSEPSHHNPGHPCFFGGDCSSLAREFEQKS